MITEHNVPFSAELGYTELFSDFMNGSDGAASLFEDNSIPNAINGIEQRAYDRKTLVDILRRQNSGWGAGPETIANIEKLNDDTSVIVATGQQACLFGGPYMVILKALGAILRAREIEEQFNIPAVPLFWIAADDHDFEEISFVHLFDSQRKLARLSIANRADAPAFPVGALEYDDSIETAVQQAIDILPDNDFKNEISDMLRRHNGEGASIIDAFAGLMHDLVGSYGLVLFNPYDEQFKKAAAPIMADIIAQQTEMIDALTAREKLLLESGYHIQAVKADTAAHMFFNNPTRTAIHAVKDHFRAGESLFSEEELITAIEKRPLAFSPDVLTRLIIQSSMFPVAAFIGGPAEIAYFAQMRPLFELFDLPAPQLCARPSATIIEATHQKAIEQFDLTYKAYTVGIADTYSALMEESFPKHMGDELAVRREMIQAEYDRMASAVVEFDTTLKDVATKTGEKIDYQIAELGKKVFAAHKKQNKIIKEKLDRLHESVYPDRSPAERVVSIVHFLSRYGQPVIEFLYQHISLEQSGHQLMYLSESDG